MQPPQLARPENGSNPLAQLVAQQRDDANVNNLGGPGPQRQAFGAPPQQPARPAEEVFSEPPAGLGGPPMIAGPGPVRCDGSSSDDDEQGIVKVKFGAEDEGPLGIEFKEVSIKSCNPGGMGQFRAGRPLEAGMILRAINGVPADRLAFNA